MRLALALTLLTASLPAIAEKPAWPATYGQAPAMTEVLPAATLLADPAAYVGKTVTVEGRVADVCQKAGCWMVIAEGDKSMRILMKDHAFSVDKQGAGKACLVQGVVEAKVIDQETVAHFEGESANKAVIPEKAQQTSYQIVATGVALR